MLYAYHVALVLAFLALHLTSFTNSASRAAAARALGVVILGLFVVGFACFGWKAGVVAVVLSFVLYTSAARPLAARFLGKVCVCPPSRALREIQGVLGAERTDEDFVQEVYGGGRRAEALADLICYCQAQPENQEVLSAFGASREELEKLYRFMTMCGACQWRGGHFVCASALVYPETLEHALRWLAEHPDPRGRDSAAVLRLVRPLLMYFHCGEPLPASEVG